MKHIAFFILILNIFFSQTILADGLATKAKIKTTCPSPLESLGNTCACPHYADKSLGRPYGKVVNGHWQCPDSPTPKEAAKKVESVLPELPEVVTAPTTCPEKKDIPGLSKEEAVEEKDSDAGNYCQDFLNLSKLNIQALRQEAKAQAEQECTDRSIDKVPTLDELGTSPEMVETYFKKLEHFQADANDTGSMTKETQRNWYYNKLIGKCFKNQGLENDVLVDRYVSKVGDENVIPKLNFMAHCKFDVSCAQDSPKEKSKKYEDCINGFKLLSSTDATKIIPGLSIPGITIPDASGLAKKQKAMSKISKSQKEAYCKIFVSVKSSQFKNDEDHFDFKDKPFHGIDQDFYKKLGQIVKKQCVKFAQNKKNEELFKKKCLENKGKKQPIFINQDELGENFMCKDKIQLDESEDSITEMGYPVESCEYSSICDNVGHFVPEKIAEKHTKETMKIHSNSVTKKPIGEPPFLTSAEGCMVEKYDYIHEFMPEADESHCKAPFNKFDYTQKAEGNNSGKDCVYKCVCISPYDKNYKDSDANSSYKGKNTSGHAQCVLK